MKDIHLAASLLLLRNSKEQMEVLLLRRSSELVFAPAQWVFPGGRVDAVDFDNGFYGSEAEAVIAATARASIRETKEEAGIDIDDSELLYFAHWTTPPNNPRRFATWFFVTEMGHEQPIQVDQSEIVDYCWITPKAALARQKVGDLPMMPPAFVALTDLSFFNSVEDALAHYCARGCVAVCLPGVNAEGQREGTVVLSDSKHCTQWPETSHRRWLLNESAKFNT